MTAPPQRSFSAVPQRPSPLRLEGARGSDKPRPRSPRGKVSPALSIDSDYTKPAADDVLVEDKEDSVVKQIEQVHRKLNDMVGASRQNTQALLSGIVEYAESMLLGQAEALRGAEEMMAAQLYAIEQKHCLEISQVCAENAMLREQLAIITTTMPSLYQDVLLNDVKGNSRASATAWIAAKNKSKTAPLQGLSSKAAVKNLGKASVVSNLPAGLGMRSHHASMVGTAWGTLPSTQTSPSPTDAGLAAQVERLQQQAAAARGAAIHGPAPGEAGSWQSIVAWIPAKLRSPEPWQPLSGDVKDGIMKLNSTGSTNSKVPSTPPAPKSPAMFLHTVTSPQQPPPLLSDTSILPGASGQIEECGDESLQTLGWQDAESEVPDLPTRKSTASSVIESYEILEAWLPRKEKIKSQKSARSSAFRTRSGSEGSLASTPFGPEDSNFKATKKSRFIIHPHSKKRMTWDVASLGMVIFDMAMIPMTFYDLPDTFFLMFMDWCTRLFWTLDIFWSCSTGVVLQDGTILWDIKLILLRYMKTWFFLDFVIVSTDWLEVIVDVMVKAAGAGLVGKLTRSFRIVRVVRLLRLVRMKEVVSVITERIQSDKIALCAHMLKLVLCVCCFGHIFGCMWFGIGTMNNDGWVVDYKYDGKPLDSQYLVSLRWSLSKFTGGGTDVAPKQMVEQLYAVFLAVIGFIASTAMVSNLTSRLTHTVIMQGQHSQNVATLKKYLKQNGISSNLALRVQRNAQHAISGDLTPEAVDLLHVVCESLRAEVHFEMYSPALSCHAFFQQYISETPVASRKICHCAVSTLFLSPNDEVFLEGEAPRDPMMYIMGRGSCEYEIDGEVEPVNEKVWAAEPCLWTAQWLHRGTLVAISDVKVVTLCQVKFAEVATHFRCGSADPRAYAVEFIKYLNEHIADVNDLTKIR